MKVATKSILVLMICFFKVFHTTATSDAAVPLVITSNQAERHLSTNCATFTHDGSNLNNAFTWKTSDDTTLNTFCSDSTHDCCKTGAGDVNADSECEDWSKDVTYIICSGSCKGSSACYDIANASSGGTVQINQDACSGGGWICASIGSEIDGEVDIEVGAGSCNGLYSACYYLGGHALNIKSIKVPENECNQENESDVYYNSELVSKCNSCGYTSTFTGTFVATDSCCAKDGYYYDGPVTDYYDEACNYTPPPEEPNPCKNVNCSNRGKCQVLTFTDAECKCENTFIQSENKLDCICPSDHQFNANANRCFPITKSPSKSPTLSPTVTSSVSPSQKPTEEVEDAPCEDDETATFELIRQRNKFKPCSWINKNWKKRVERQEMYCVLDHVKTMCPASCGMCAKDSIFEKVRLKIHHQEEE